MKNTIATSSSANNGAKGYLYLICLVAALGGFLFGFDTVVCDGHNFEELQAAFDVFLNNQKNKTGRPTAIIAKSRE